MMGPQELILILAVLLVVFGPKKLPEMAKELGKAIQEFRKASSNIADAASSALIDEVHSEDTIAKIASNLGVDTEGKSTRQLLEEIQRKTVKNEEGTDTQEDR